MALFSLEELRETASYLREFVPPTPQYNWPLLCERTGCDVWVKHENHTPIGAFKARSVFGYLHSLIESGARVSGTISATRGNHGQSVALASKLAGLAERSRLRGLRARTVHEVGEGKRLPDPRRVVPQSGDLRPGGGVPDPRRAV